MITWPSFLDRTRNLTEAEAISEYEGILSKLEGDGALIRPGRTYRAFLENLVEGLRDIVSKESTAAGIKSDLRNPS